MLLYLLSTVLNLQIFLQDLRFHLYSLIFHHRCSKHSLHTDLQQRQTKS
uniref:Uncharacterized protein n=1 Tax=Podoviridae sp. ctZkC8 TaxID=2825259 RepID=A0A8S5UBU6_9CAUD|nr:MAG TPA: hypothetical protein [Podoviridae sp. ctZkC8]